MPYAPKPPHEEGYLARGAAAMYSPAASRAARRLPPLIGLRAFEAVARHRNIRRAARELNVDHTVVSRHLRSLQQVLEISLVKSSRQGVVLTTEGETYASIVTSAFSLIADATIRLRSDVPIRALSIRCAPAFASLWVTPRLAELRHLLYPLDLELQSTLQCPSDSDAKVDVEIRAGKPPESNLRYLVLCHPRVIAVAGPEWLKAHPDIRTPRDLVQAPLIHDGSHEGWLAWFVACNVLVSAPLSGVSLWHAPMAIEAARRGGGVALTDELVGAADIACGALVEIGRTDVHMAPYCFVASADRWDLPPIVRLREWLSARLKLP